MPLPISMDNSMDRAEFCRLLAETIAWCRLHTLVDDPKNRLRTPALRPANLNTTLNQWGNYDYESGKAMLKQSRISFSISAQSVLNRAFQLRFAHGSIREITRRLSDGRSYETALYYAGAVPKART